MQHLQRCRLCTGVVVKGEPSQKARLSVYLFIFVPMALWSWIVVGNEKVRLQIQASEVFSLVMFASPSGKNSE